MQPTEHICLMADYNQWMNNKVYEAARSLPVEALKAERQAFFGSILGTLNHLAVGDTLWLQRFARHPAQYPALEPLRQLPSPTRLDQQLHAELDSLAQYRAFLDQIICQWARSIRAPELDQVLQYQNSKGVPMQKNFFSLLMHFFNHQTHHRGQVSTLLSQARVDIGVTDLLALIPDTRAL